MRSEVGLFKFDELTIGSTWYFDQKLTLGPLTEFEYINKTSNIFGRYSQFEDRSSDTEFDTALIGGEYFAGNVPIAKRDRGA